MKPKIKELLEKSSSFNPKEDFTGTKALKVPKVTKGLADANKSLNNAQDEIPKIMEELDKI